jgi:O-antigen ligase
VIRITLLWMLIAFLAVYAWRDWFKALCGLVLLMAVVEHPDMPKTLFGIQGMNPWNILLGIIVMAWFMSRQREELRWDMPSHVNWLLFLYLSVVIIGFYRMINDYSGMTEFLQIMKNDPPTVSGLWSEYFINTFKWVVPGLLMFDGCRDRSRFNWALVSVLGVYFLLGLQVIKWMPLDSLTSGATLTHRSLKIIVNEIGYHRVNLASMLAGAAWAIFATHKLADSRLRMWMIIGASFVTVFALGLTGGRTGYGTWAVVGFILGSLRWRKALVMAVPVALIVALVVPAAVERFSQGFTPESRDTNTRIHGRDTLLDSNEPDLYTITAGRNIAWPYVIDKIAEEPWIGFGREAMVRTGVSTFLITELGESFPHPHNAYLQLLLDNGWIGFIPIILYYYLMLRNSMRLFKDSSDPIYMTAGGVSAALLLSFLVSSIGSQTFYPREGAVGMWCAMGLMMRVYVERARLLADSPVESPDSVRKIWVQAS